MKIVVIETGDYAIFKKLQGNRDLKSVNKIKDSISKVGYIPSPICVNEKMEVIDGQNRLEAARQLGLPVYYYVVPQIGIKEAIQMNIGRKDWAPIDYCKSFAISGNRNYQRLLDMMDEYRSFPLQEMYGICKNVIVESGWATAGLKQESFLSLSEEECEQAKAVIPYIEALLPDIKKVAAQKRIVTTAIAWCLRVNGVDRDKFVMKFMKGYPEFRPAVHAKTFIEDIQEAYNKSNKNKVWFDIEYRKSKEREDFQ